jgi:hypothetical protein
MKLHYLNFVGEVRNRRFSPIIERRVMPCAYPDLRIKCIVEEKWYKYKVKSNSKLAISHERLAMNDVGVAVSKTTMNIKTCISKN